VKVLLAADEQDVMLGTNDGQAIRFAMSKFRQMGKGTRGVKGITLGEIPIDEETTKVIGMVVIQEGKTILTVTKKGYGKRTEPDEYRVTGRGGKGVRNIKIIDKNGPAVAIACVSEEDELMILTKNGILIKMKMNSLSVLGRSTQGLRAIRLGEGDYVADAEHVEVEDSLEDTSNDVNSGSPESPEEPSKPETPQAG
jgi:DNA gyrase subunit A